jgi:hypothetical protein
MSLQEYEVNWTFHDNEKMLLKHSDIQGSQDVRFPYTNQRTSEEREQNPPPPPKTAI